jgi:phage gpG-like protein
MTFDELGDYFLQLPDEIMTDVPDIIAETATEYFKETFTKKGFDGNAWPQAKTTKQTGSLMVQSGNLVNSIQPSYIGRDKVVISAGNEKVPYAQIHNEGGETHPTVTPKMRKMAWAKYKATGNETWKGLAMTKKQKLDVKIPQRQFMGNSKELAARLVERIEGLIKSIINA